MQSERGYLKLSFRMNIELVEMEMRNLNKLQKDFSFRRNDII